ncbi:MAG: CBS domain-containing protein [Thaumarchaeota archaeon]|jgi:CBS domain-containing protein|nr:CBS domain-containing protein [Candidatus Wolframiiraptor allenii]
MSAGIPLVKDVMRREVYLVEGNDPVSRAIGIMREHNAPLVIVVDKLENGRILGAITERMIMRATYNPDAMKAKTVAARIPRISSSASVAEAARLMLENHVLALPVEEDGKIIGVIAVEDVVQAMGDEFFSKIRVGDVMSRELVSIGPRDTVGQAIALMREHGISRLPVVDGGKLVGVVTIHDIIIKVIQPRQRVTRGEYAGEKLRTLSHQVKDIMTTDVIVARPDEPLSTAMRRMLEADVSCLIVVHDGRPVGILTRTDILAPIAALAEGERRAISVQLSFKVNNLSESDKEQVMEVVERFLRRLGESVGVGYLMLHFKEHKEKHGETHMIHCRARLNTDKAHVVGIGEGWTPALAARVALDIIERKLVVMKENMQKYPYAEELLSRIAAEI